MSTSFSPLVQIDHVSKKFDSHKAVSNVTLEINSGEIYALIGPNSAGKTTIIKTLVGLLEPTSGRVKIAGYDVATHPLDAKKQLGYVSDDPSLYEYLTGREFLAFAGNLKGLRGSVLKRSISAVLDIFPLTDVLDTRIEYYSRGNKQKISFLASLLGAPKVLIIDEPIVGLDPLSIKRFGETLRSFARRGGSILFTTHILEFASAYADRVGILHRGSLLYEGEIKSERALTERYTKLTQP